MKHLSSTTCALLALLVAASSSIAQEERPPQIDLVRAQFTNAEKDCAAAIKRRDFRFLTIDREQRIVPGVERFPRWRRVAGVKFVPQPLRLFPGQSDNFSYDLRTRRYAAQYNRSLLKHLRARYRSVPRRLD